MYLIWLKSEHGVFWTQVALKVQSRPASVGRLMTQKPRRLTWFMAAATSRAVHRIVAGAQLAEGKPEMARDRFGFLERHEYSKEMPQGYSVSSADRYEI